MTGIREDTKDKLPPPRDGSLPVEPDQDTSDELHQRHEDTENIKHREQGGKHSTT